MIIPHLYSWSLWNNSSYKYCRWHETLNHHKNSQTLCHVQLFCQYIMVSIEVFLMELHAITVCPGDYPLLQKHFHDFNDFVSEAKAKSWKTLVQLSGGVGAMWEESVIPRLTWGDKVFYLVGYFFDLQPMFMIEKMYWVWRQYNFTHSVGFDKEAWQKGNCFEHAILSLFAFAWG